MIDVFVIGAGPSGLLMTAELIRHGLTCRLIDKNSSPSDKSKAIAMQARTLEVLNYVGVAEECIAQGLKITHFIPTSHGKKICDISFKETKTPYPFVLSLEQSKLELILIKKLETLGCRIERGVELLDFQQNEQDIRLFLKNNSTGNIEVCQTKWLIGCDGAHSTVRKQLDLEFEGKSFPQIFSLVDLEVEWKYPRNCFMGFLEEKDILFAAPIQEKNRYRLIFQLERGRDFLKRNKHLKQGEISSTDLPKPTLEEVAQIVHQYADANAVVKNPVWLTHFNVSSRMVSRYQKGRVFLVGDAAHIHSPVGGQGMNTGLQDGFNLAWKIAFAHKRKSKASLLESYHDERYFVGKNLLKGTEKTTNFILTRSKFLIFLRNAFMSLMTSFSAVRNKFVSTVSEINVYYPLSQWIVQTRHPSLKLQAGRRAPNAAIFYEGLISSLFSLWKTTTSFHLLLIDLKAQFSNIDDIAKILETQNAGFVKVHVVRSNGANDGKYLQDLHKEIQTLYGDLTIYLIRPDGYVGYCGPLSRLEPLHEYLNNFRTSF